MNRLHGAAAMALAALATTALAQAIKGPAPGASPAAMPAPRPAPELDKLKWFSGTWTCEGQFAGGMGMPAHPTKARVTTKSDLDGFFYSVRYEEEKTKDNPMPYRGAGFWGYDRETKKYTSIWADNMGGGAPQTSAGWEGDKLVFSGDATMMGKKMGVRDTFTRKGDNELVHMGEMQMDGKWSKMSEETCKKSGGMR